MVLGALGGVCLLGYGWRHHVTHFLRGSEKVFRGSQAVLGHRVNAQGAGSVEWNSMRSVSPVPGMPGASQLVRPTRELSPVALFGLIARGVPDRSAQWTLAYALVSM